MGTIVASILHQFYIGIISLVSGSTSRTVSHYTWSFGSMEDWPA
jgi:hypothetical protein